jgi:hypothetical protein
VWRTIGNFCYDYGVLTTASALSFLGGFTSAVINIPTNLETPPSHLEIAKTVGAAVALFTVFAGGEKFVRQTCTYFQYLQALLLTKELRP